jgi:hypothetical protein
LQYPLLVWFHGFAQDEGPFCARWHRGWRRHLMPGRYHPRRASATGAAPSKANRAPPAGRHQRRRTAKRLSRRGRAAVLFHYPVRRSGTLRAGRSVDGGFGAYTPGA